MSDSKRSAALLVVGAAAAVTAVVLAVLALTRDDAPTASPPPTSQPTASPTAAPVPQPERFAVTLRAVRVQEMGNGWIYRRRMGNTRRGARRHARAAVRELNRYLDAALVAPTTRFTDGPVNRLLTGDAEAALNRRGRRALAVGAPPIIGGRTGKAKARAVVLYDGKRAHAVTLSYRARLNVLVPGADKAQPLRQRGVLVFVPTRAGWRADQVDVRTRLPQRATGATPTEDAS